MSFLPGRSHFWCALFSLTWYCFKFNIISCLPTVHPSIRCFEISNVQFFCQIIRFLLKNWPTHRYITWTCRHKSLGNSFIQLLIFPCFDTLYFQVNCSRWKCTHYLLLIRRFKPCGNCVSWDTILLRYKWFRLPILYFFSGTVGATAHRRMSKFTCRRMQIFIKQYRRPQIFDRIFIQSHRYIKNVCRSLQINFTMLQKKIKKSKKFP